MAYALSCWISKLTIFSTTDCEIRLVGERNTIRLYHVACTWGSMLVDTYSIAALYVEDFICQSSPCMGSGSFFFRTGNVI